VVELIGEDHVTKYGGKWKAASGTVYFGDWWSWLHWQPYCIAVVAGWLQGCDSR
jgi:hypothetical protein